MNKLIDQRQLVPSGCYTSPTEQSRATGLEVSRKTPPCDSHPWQSSSLFDKGIKSTSIEKKKSVLIEVADKLSHINYQALVSKLFANDVVTLDEMRTIKSSKGSKAYGIVLEIINRDLQAGYSQKYDGFISTLEKSEDVLNCELAEDMKKQELAEQTTIQQWEANKPDLADQVPCQSSHGVVRKKTVATNTIEPCSSDSIPQPVQQKLTVLTGHTKALCSLSYDSLYPTLFSKGVISFEKNMELKDLDPSHNRMLLVLLDIATDLLIGNDTPYDRFFECLRDSEDVLCRGVAEKMTEITCSESSSCTGTEVINHQLALGIMTSYYEILINHSHDIPSLISCRVITWSQYKDMKDYSNRNNAIKIVDDIMKELSAGYTRSFLSYIKTMKESEDVSMKTIANEIWRKVLIK